MLSIEPTFLDSYAGPNVRRVLLFRDKVSYNAGLRYNFSDSFLVQGVCWNTGNPAFLHELFVKGANNRGWDSFCFAPVFIRLFWCFGEMNFKASAFDVISSHGRSTAPGARDP